jgi:hypothetical protein
MVNEFGIDPQMRKAMEYSSYLRDNGLTAQDAPFQDWSAQQASIGSSKTPQLTQAQIDLQTQELKQKSAQSRIAYMKAQGLNEDGSPIRPEFESILNPDGTMPDQYKYKPTTIDPANLQGYNMIKNLATTGVGKSEYANISKQQNDMNRQDQIDAATGQSASGTRMAIDNLASRGGVSSGARERISASGNRDLLMQKQGAYRTSGNNLLDILKNDNTYKNDATKQFAEAEGKIAFGNNDLNNKAGQYNLENVLKEKDAGRSYNMDTYKSALDKWGAGKQADATRSSGGGGGK